MPQQRPLSIGEPDNLPDGKKLLAYKNTLQNILEIFSTINLNKINERDVQSFEKELATFYEWIRKFKHNSNVNKYFDSKDAMLKNIEDAIMKLNIS